MQALQKNLKPILKAAALIAVGMLLFGMVQQLLMDKSAYAQYRQWKRQENVDVLVLGNSHAQDGISARMMEDCFQRSIGVRPEVFNYSIFGMRVEQMYFFAKEILKHHVPDLVVLETYAFCPLADEHRDVLAHRAFDPLPLNANKIEAIRYCVKEDRWSHYIPLIKYHSRWQELVPDDIAMLYSRAIWETSGDGGSQLTDVCEDPGDGWFQQDVHSMPGVREITPSQKECFEKLLALFEEKGVQTLLVSLPYKEQIDLNSLEMIKINRYLQEHYVNGNTVQMLDMNLLWEEMDFDYQDLNDFGHANKAGCEKMTSRLVQYLNDHYDIPAMAQ